MVRALTVTLVVWALCAYSMYAFRQVRVEKFRGESGSVNATPDKGSHIRKINDRARALYALSPTWIGRGQIEVDGSPAQFEVMFMSVAEDTFAGNPEKETSFLGRMFLHFKGKTYDIVDDSQYAGDMVVEDGYYFMHWRMPSELEDAFGSIMATMPDGDKSIFRIERADATWSESAYIQWEPTNDSEWFENFDRQLASVEQ